MKNKRSNVEPEHINTDFWFNQRSSLYEILGKHITYIGENQGSFDVAQAVEAIIEYLMKESFPKYLAKQEATDNTKELLNDIISWEKDLSEYKSLEGILRERYIITKRQPVEQKPSESAEGIPSEIVTKMQEEFQPTTITNFQRGMYSGYAFGLQDGYKYASQKQEIPSDEEIEKQADWFIEHIYAGYASRALRSAMVDMGKWMKERIKK